MHNFSMRQDLALITLCSSGNQLSQGQSAPINGWQRQIRNCQPAVVVRRLFIVYLNAIRSRHYHPDVRDVETDCATVNHEDIVARWSFPGMTVLQVESLLLPLRLRFACHSTAISLACFYSLAPGPPPRWQRRGRSQSRHRPRRFRSRPQSLRLEGCRSRFRKLFSSALALEKRVVVDSSFPFALQAQV